jgi:colanic acid/amylovoran biosynthesis glycosyltransferase
MFLRIENLHVFHPMRGFALARLLEKENVNYIHCYGTSYPATRALVASRLLGVPFSISTFVDFDFEYPYKCLMEKLQLATFVVTCTEFCKKRLIDLTDAKYEKKIHVIYFGLDRRYGSIGEPCSAYHKNTKPGIFTACRLVEKKGIEYLIRACSLLKERGHSCNCLIIGDGQERERLEKLVIQSNLADQVRFLGALPNHKIWEIVGPEDLCVVPSVYCSDGERDGIPVILLEAVANGHPAVSTFVSGIPEFITDRVHGLLVPERDALALANAIEELLNNGELRRQFVLAGQERLREDFNISDKTTQLWSLINDNYTIHR